MLAGEEIIARRSLQLASEMKPCTPSTDEEIDEYSQYVEDGNIMEKR